MLHLLYLAATLSSTVTPEIPPHRTFFSPEAVEIAGQEGLFFPQAQAEDLLYVLQTRLPAISKALEASMAANAISDHLIEKDGMIIDSQAKLIATQDQLIESYKENIGGDTNPLMWILVGSGSAVALAIGSVAGFCLITHSCHL